MTVLQICAYAAPYEGNFMKSLYFLEQELLKQGHKTIYVFPITAMQRPWCRELSHRVPVYFLPLSKARIHPLTYLKLVKIFRAHPEIEVAHSHFELYDLPLAIIAPKHIRLFWHLHDALILPDQKSRHLLFLLQYKLFSKRATLLSVADVYKEELISLGVPNKQAFTVFNGIDLNRITYVDPTAHKDFDFLAFVWSNSVKGLDIILDACKMLETSGRDFRILLIGNNTTSQEVVLRFPNGSKHICVSPSVDDVNVLFNNASSFISASRHETFSYAVCEACYAGLPVLSSKIPGLKWAAQLPTVTFFESENANMLYLKMCDFLDKKSPYSPDQLQETRNIIAQNFSCQKWTLNILKHYGCL